MSVWTCLRALVISLCLCLLLNCPRAVSTFELTVLHTNDYHDRIEETSEDSVKCRGSDPCFAGVARMSTKVTEIRRNEKNVLLLDSGDQFQGTVWFNFYKGVETAHFMNKLGYDAMALGNHEFDNGVEGLIQPFLQNVTFPVVSANIKADQTLAPSLGRYLQPYTVINVGSEKVAVVGYTSVETPFLARPGEHLTFEDEVRALQVQVDKLEALGYNKIIALGHSGINVDQEIAKRVKGVDVVIGGHSNTFLYTGDPPSTEVPTGPYPLTVRSNDGRNVPVVQAYAFGKYLGYLKVTFDDAGNVIKAVGNPILLDSSIPQDPDVLADVETWKINLAQFSLLYVGQTLVYLNATSKDCRSRECNLGNLICDAMVYNYLRYSSDLPWNAVASCMLNGGAIRATIDERNNNGNITMEEIINVLPFVGTFDLVRMNGSTVKKAFEHAIHRYGDRPGEFLQVSGIHVEYDVSEPVNQRVVSLSMLCTECRVPTYEPLDPEKTYSVVMPSFIAGGGDGFTMIKDELLKLSTGDTYTAVFSKYVSEMERVYPAVEGRIAIRSSAIFPALSLVSLLLGLCLSLTL